MTEPQGRIDARTTVKLPLSDDERGALTTYLDTTEEAYRVCNVALHRAWNAYLKARAAVARTRGDVASARAYAAQKAALDARTAAANGVKAAAFTAARAVYEASGHASPLACWLLDSDDFPGDEVDQVVDALAEGMSLQGVIDMAEERHWCDTWDYALGEALERFNFIE